MAQLLWLLVALALPALAAPEPGPAPDPYPRAAAAYLVTVNGAVSQANVIVTTVAGRRFERRSGNLLLGRVAGAVGVKSGYTSRAGKCLVALVRRGDDEVAVLLLNAPDRWWSASVLVDDSFAALDASRR